MVQVGKTFDQKERYPKREITTKRKKYMLLRIISMNALHLRLSSLLFLELRGSSLTILARMRQDTTSYKLRHNETLCDTLVTHHSPTQSFAAFGSPGFERPVSPPSTIALSSATERGLTWSPSIVFIIRQVYIPLCIRKIRKYEHAKGVI